MSLKIYNGYKLPKMDAIELNAFIVAFRKLAEQKASELTAKAMANLISEKLDDLTIFGQEQFIKRHLKEKGVSQEDAERKFRLCSTHLHAYMELRDRYYEIQRTSQRDPAMDFDCDAIFIPLEDKTLVLFYAERKEFRELWKQQQGVQEYFYYDNVEPDSKVTKEEWKQRKHDWLTIWSDDKQAKELGIEVRFARGVPERYTIEMDDILKSVSTLEERSAYVAWNKLYDVTFKQMRVDSEEEDWLDTDRRVSRWIRSDEGQDALKKTTEECKLKLVPEFTSKHVSKRYRDFLMELSNKQG